MSKLRDFLRGLHQTDGDILCQKAHEQINHPYHKTMIRLVQEGNILKGILKVKDPLAYASCIFGVAHGKP